MYVCIMFTTASWAGSQPPGGGLGGSLHSMYCMTIPSHHITGSTGYINNALHDHDYGDVIHCCIPEAGPLAF